MEAETTSAILLHCARLTMLSIIGGTIKRESIYAYKSMLVALNGAFNHETIDLLLFVADVPQFGFVMSGDGLLKFSGLIAAGLVKWRIGLSSTTYTKGHSD
jgi:hypothetical protein